MFSPYQPLRLALPVLVLLALPAAAAPSPLLLLPGSSLVALQTAWHQGLPADLAMKAPSPLPIPLLDSNYEATGAWGSYLSDYLPTLPTPWNTADSWTLTSSGGMSVIRDSGPGQIVEVRYGRHEELERMLQKLYFELMRGPVIMTTAYDPKTAPAEYANWICFQGGQREDIPGDHTVQTTFVDFRRLRTIAVTLETHSDGHKIWIWDEGVRYRGDHNALVAMGIAVQLAPQLQGNRAAQEHLHWTIPISRLSFRPDLYESLY